MSSDTGNRLKALAAAVFWGVSFVATKSALTEVRPLTIIVLRFALGVIVLMFALWQARLVKLVSGRDLALLAILGAISIAIHQGLQLNGLDLSSATNVAWLVALNPVFTAVLAWVLLSEAFAPVQLLGLLMAFIGAIAVVTKGALSPETLQLPSTIGDMLALASALNWAIFSVVSKPLLKRLAPKLMVTYVMTFGWLMVLPFWLVGQGWNELGSLTINGWAAILFLGVICSGLAYLFWYDALAGIDASQVAAFIYIEPLVTVIVAAVVLSESITLPTMLGGLLILAGVSMVNSKQKRPQSQTVAVTYRLRLALRPFGLFQEDKEL